MATSWSQAYKTHPVLNKSGMKLCWHNNYWDGPISGILEYNGGRYYFDQCDEWDGVDQSGDAWYRRFLLYELTKEQMDEELYFHDLFQKYVGTHTDYNNDGKRQIGATKPRELWDNYYNEEKNRKKLDVKDNKIIGWFGSNKKNIM